MKKILSLLFVLMATLSANAQFEEGKTYVGANLTGLDMNISGAEKFRLSAGASGGYFIMDNVLLMANLGIEKNGSDINRNVFSIGAGGRYYFVENGIFLGASANYTHVQKKFNDILPQVEAGYAFFINRSVTIEPAVYFQASFINADRDRFGLKVGIGINLETNKKDGCAFTMEY